MITRAAIVAEAITLVGTPYHHQGKLKGIGMDCIAVVGYPALVLGMPEAAAWNDDVRCQGYDRMPSPKMMLAACERYLDRIPLPQHAYIADIVLMVFEDDPQHFALITSIHPPRIVHASASAGKVVRHTLGKLWRDRIDRAYRYRGIV